MKVKIMVSDIKTRVRCTKCYDSQTWDAILTLHNPYDIICPSCGHGEARAECYILGAEIENS